jgi:tRNA1(Val) A37 N6-methylase TrmN6
LFDRVQGQIDLLVFNPPYVPTDEDEQVSIPISQLTRGCGIHRKIRGSEGPGLEDTKVW